MNDMQRFLEVARGLTGLSEFVFHDNGGEPLLTYRTMTAEEWEARYAVDEEEPLVLLPVVEPRTEVANDKPRIDHPSPKPAKIREVPRRSGGGDLIVRG